ncbi:MAG TPA: peptide-methionine (S)-S-oxide reductase MsrA [Myxococcota bacterium]|nr:peptide-methionine (S)-S-oxide reductase MsrA [Myxococcota bacterium]
MAAETPESPVTAPPPVGRAVAIFSGGCFWCMEPPFDALPGVLATTSGYTGGTVANPTYEQVSSGSTGHRESVQVEYDPARVSYAQLLDVFWHNVDPTDAGGQFCDRGQQYTTAIFATTPEQLGEATEARQRLDASHRLPHPVVTSVLPAGPFYPAEEYHQNYYQKNPLRYRVYRAGCGRDHVLEQLWGAAPAH